MGEERGQVMPLMLFIATAVLVGTSLLVSVIGGEVEAQMNAQLAADAAALAAVVEGDEHAAVTAAGANDGEVVQFRWVDRDALVTVEVRGKRAQARARPGLTPATVFPRAEELSHGPSKAR